MTDINKQKFLVELGRLLTFMSEEDRQEALTLYEKMFDDANDDQAVIQALGSTTRQAVIIARAYDSNARKLQAYASAQRKAAHEAPEATPDFVLAILRVFEEVVPLPVERQEEPAPDPAPAPVVKDPEEPDAPPEHDPNQLSIFDPSDPEDGESPDPEQETRPDPMDEVESFIQSFKIKDELDAEEQSRTVTSEEDEAEKPEEEPERSEDEEEVPPPATERRLRPFLLILFILAAVPLTLLVVCLLLVPTLLSLVLAAASIVGGCAAAVAAFSGFSVFADILILLGCAIILLALGLLFLWLFIWFVGTVIGGLIRWVIQLGRDCCYKEVSA